MDSEVRNVIDVERVTINNVPTSPTLPTTHPKRRYIITPRMVSMDGVNTPPNVFNRFGIYLLVFLIKVNLLIISIMELNALFSSRYHQSNIQFYREADLAVPAKTQICME